MMIHALFLSAIMQGQPAYDFARFLGVNIHPDRTDGIWPDYQRVEQFIRGIGFTHVRSSLTIADDPKIAAFMQKLDNDDKPPSIKSIGLVNESIVYHSQVAPLIRYWGIEEIELPNERDIHTNNWVLEDQTTLNALNGSGHVLDGIAIIAPSVVFADPAQLGDLSKHVQFGNMHNYTNNRMPETQGYGGDVYGNGTVYGSFDYGVKAAQRAAPGLPVWSTESGYATNQGGLTEETQASYLERSALLCAAKKTHCDFYDLSDDNENFGLVHRYGTPKLSAFGMQGELAVLADTSRFLGTCQVDATITSSAPIMTSVYCKSNGEIDIVVHQPVELQDPINFTPKPVTPATVSIVTNVPGTRRLYSQTPAYQWLSDDAPDATILIANERPLILALNAGKVASVSFLP